MLIPNIYRFFLARLMVWRASLIMDEASFSLIREDSIRWFNELKLDRKSDSKGIAYLLIKYPYFRNIFYLRYESRIFEILLPKRSDLKLQRNCKYEGGALFFVHPFSTIINAQEIGYGCTFRNNTTIGESSRNLKPRIGKNIDFGAATVIIGDIVIGNDTIIGAGCVVVKDVPSDSKVVGSPMRFL